MTQRIRAVVLLPEDRQMEAWQLEALKAARGAGLLEASAFVIVPPAEGEPVATNRPIPIWGALAAATMESRRVSPQIDVPTSGCVVEHVAGGLAVVTADPALFDGADCVVNFSGQTVIEVKGIDLPRGVLSYPDLHPNGFADFRALADGIRMRDVGVGVQVCQSQSIRILASASAQVTPQSFRKTVASARRAAIPLLAIALRSSPGDPPQQSVSMSSGRAPITRRESFRELRRVLGAGLRRVAYGAFAEQEWRLVRLPLPHTLASEVVLDPAEGVIVKAPPGYSFAADPHAFDQDAVYAELLEARTGIGRIARWNDQGWAMLDLGVTGHLSYPQVVRHAGRTYLFPEMASVAGPALFELSSGGDVVLGRTSLLGLEGERLVDATLHCEDSTWYLFAGRAGDEGGRLDLWIAADLIGPYLPHPSTPVQLTPAGARMAGPLIFHDGRLLRFGQDGTQSYGGQITIYRVETLSPQSYAEKQIGVVRCRGLDGPHTFSVAGNAVWIDANKLSYTPMAGVRRARARFGRRGSDF